MDHDGKVSDGDIDMAGELLELELREEKADTQRRMAWASMISMAIFTAVLFSPIVNDARVSALADLLGLFYIAQAGIVGAYMGVTAWMSNTTSSRSSRLYSSYQTTRRSTVVDPIDDEPTETTDRTIDPDVRGR